MERTIDLEKIESSGVDTGVAKKHSHGTSPTSAIEVAEKEARRSKRQSSSTIIYINGQAVKKANNYTVNGMGYVYGPTDGVPNAKRPKKDAPKKKATDPNKKKAPTLASKKETGRIKRKQAVSQCIQKKAPARARFLHQHAHILEPFLETKVLDVLKSTGKIPVIEPPSVQTQPGIIKAELRDYQLLGLDFMNKMFQQNIGFILGDEMGLGKTLQTISLIAHLKQTGDITGPNLVVCPLSVLYSWCSEIEKWAPSLKFLRFHISSSNLQPSDLPDFGQFDIIVTTYEMCKIPVLVNSLWSREHFHLLILDEGHRIKGSDTQIAHVVRRIHCENRVILTGTPLANNLTELWSLLDFLLPGLFTTRKPFADAFDLTLNVVDRTKLAEAHKVLGLFMIRRLKAEVEKLIPQKIETKVTCPLSRDQIWWYKSLLLKDMNILARGESANHQILNNLIMQLRKCCLHPFLFPGAEDIEQTSLEQLVGASGKLATLDKLLRSLYQKNHRVVLFSQFTSVLDILEDYCSMRGWNFSRFDGSTPRAQRNMTVKGFNQEGSTKFIFLMSTRSGGVGINLQTADTCILYDSDFNPQPDIQAMARVHRIGQTKTVHVYRLITEGTVEERILERAEKKLYLDKVVMRDGSSEKGFGSDGTDDASDKKLYSTLKFGCNAVFGKGSDKNLLPSDEDIALITDRKRSEDFSHGNLQGGAAANAEDFDATKAFSSSMDFGGIDFSAIREQYKGVSKADSVSRISQLFQKRQQQKRIKMIDGLGSGYGTAMVPVLSMNNYELNTGERSVFDQELQGRTARQTKKKKKIEFESQEYCQRCGDGGKLVLCSRCPVSVHLSCCGLTSNNDFMFCSHHRCVVCNKSASHVGGLLFPCNICPNSFCEDHLPGPAKFIDTNERMEELGYSIKNGVYIHCSSQCEQYAIAEYGYTEPIKQGKQPCPEKLDVDCFFGDEIDSGLIAPGDLIAHSNLPSISQTL